MRLTEAVRRPELAGDERFATFADRAEHAEVLVDLLSEIFGGRTTAEWLDVLDGTGIPHAPVRTLPEAMADPALQARQMVVEADHPAFGRLRLPSTALRVGEARPVHRAAPDRGADGEAILTELLGYDPEKIEACALAGAFGPGDCGLETAKAPA